MPEFGTSPLYRALCTTVAANEDLLKLASRGRPGQYPTFLFFGAVHYLLLQGADHDLASFYPSVAGDQSRPVDAAGPALVRFCADYCDELAALIEHRLVQTSHVQRALALRLGLHVISRQVSEPVHLVEVGASAGLNLRFDRYGYCVGGRRFVTSRRRSNSMPTGPDPRRCLTSTSCPSAPASLASTSTRSTSRTRMRGIGWRRWCGRRTVTNVIC
jgi:hypothetical protein